MSSNQRKTKDERRELHRRILNGWETERGGTCPSVTEIEAAKRCGYDEGSEAFLSLALGFRPEGSTADQRAYANDDLGAYNTGALRGELKEQYFRNKPKGTPRIIPSGEVWPLQVKSGRWVFASDEGKWFKVWFADEEASTDLKQLNAQDENTILARRIIGEYERRLLETPDMERWAWVKQRAHQMALRKVILEERHGKCQVTALGIRELLEACHIVPYCEGKEQWNPDNALLLAVHIHALFDAHLISFDETGKIMISDCLTPGERAILGLREDMQLAGHERHQIFLTNHMVLLKQPEPSLT